MKYTLKYPVTDADGKEYSALILSRPAVKDLKAIETIEGEVGKVAELIERLAKGSDGSQMTTIAVNKIDSEDFTGLSEIISGFFNRSPQLGEK